MNPANSPNRKDPKEFQGQRPLGWRLFRIISGWTLIVLGVIGLFLPFLQGILFLVSGLALLSTESRWAKNLMDRIKAWRPGRSAAPRPPGSTPPKRSDSPPNAPN